jgi:hypothetical protein
MKTTVTEKFDATGKLVERITVTDDGAMHPLPYLLPYQPAQPYAVPIDPWYDQRPIITWTGPACYNGAVMCSVENGELPTHNSAGRTYWQ